MKKNKYFTINYIFNRNFLDKEDGIDESKRFKKPKLNKSDLLPDLSYKSEDEEETFVKQIEIN